MTDKKPVEGQSVTRKKYTPAFKAECARQVATAARQPAVARAQGLSPTLLGLLQRQALGQAEPSSAGRAAGKRHVLSGSAGKSSALR